MHAQTHPRFAVPALVAAAFHAALFLLVRPVPISGDVLAPPEKFVPACTLTTVTLAPVPPDEVTVADQPVKPLRGDSAAQAPEPPARPTAADFTVPVPPRPVAIAPGPVSREIPKEWGSPDGVPEGVRDFSPARPGLPGADELDNAPRARFQPAPAYPLELRRDGTEGVVVVEFAVDTAGKVTGARVVESSHRGFEEATLRAVMRWQFEPGRRHGRVVPFRMAVPVTFRVTE